MFEMKMTFFVIGLAIGVFVTSVLMLLNLYSWWKDAEHKKKIAVRKAHDKGYSDGRRWRYREKEWVECELAVLADEIEEIRRKYKDNEKVREK